MSTRTRKRVERVEVTGNVFEALGFTPEQAAVYAMEVDLAVALEDWMKKQGHTQRKAAGILNVPTSKMSNVMNRKFQQTSLDYLVAMAVKAGLRPRLTFDRGRRKAA